MGHGRQFSNRTGARAALQVFFAIAAVFSTDCIGLGDDAFQSLLKQYEAQPLDFELLESPSLGDQAQSSPYEEEPIDSSNEVLQTSMLQPTPFLAPRVSLSPNVEATQASAILAASIFTSSDVQRSLLRQARLGSGGLGGDFVQGSEGNSNVSTDVGSLLGKSSRAMAVSVQKRNPVINDPRVRSSRIGSLAASGSHWVPARVDLDTVLSKFDSRQLSDIIIIPGPYSSRYGPGFQFVDFELARSPRYQGGFATHGRSSVDFKSNGGQVFGQQTVLTGSDDWGFRGTYAQRGGSDYNSGDGDQIPASYNSREFSGAYGADLGDERSIEFSLLRLDQNDIELPGYVFDIESLETEGYGVEYIDNQSGIGDRFETDLWYNRTSLNGNAFSPSKVQQFPGLTASIVPMTTDVDSLSTGYRQSLTWGKASDRSRFVAGHDLRFVKQELNEIAEDGFSLTSLNSPIPNSFSANPGFFTEYREPISESVTFTSGGRIDYAQTDIVDDPLKLSQVGNPPNSYADIVGSEQFQRDFLLGSLYGTFENQWNDQLIGTLNLGYAERLPTLTDLYAAQPFVLLLQNGLNDITGDPTLSKEKLIQCDLGIAYQGDQVRAGGRAFHAWAFDYITFENTGTSFGQVDLRTVNTDLATLAGAESYLEFFPNDPLTAFTTIRYVDGRDRTRDGDYATFSSPGVGIGSFKDFSLDRGANGIGGADAEPLPGIAPWEARVGARLRNSVQDPRWNLEIAARINGQQNRVATSLLESATPGFTVYDLRGTYLPFQKRNVTLVGGVENFTDKQYREHLDFRSRNGVTSVFQPGVNFYVGADVSY